jgi:hypothetical protein
MIRNFVVAAFACLAAAPALALDGVSLEAGAGSDEDVNPLRVAAQWNSRWRWLYWDLSFGGWTGGHGRVYDLGFTPTARVGRSPYLEAGLGAHVLSDLDVGAGSDFSTRFQFGDHLGVGMRFGHYDLGLRFQHLSNGGLRNPNPGINFLILRLQYHLG